MFKQTVFDLVREMVGFANAEGGRIYVGVADDKEIKGISINNRLLSQIQDMARKCDPPIEIKLHTIKRENKDLLLIQVPEGESKPYSCSDGYFLRTGPSSQKMNRNELLAFVRAVDVSPWERQDCKMFIYPRDFNNTAFKEFLKSANISASSSPKNLLVNLELARLVGDQLVVNNACVLFFAKAPVRFFPQARVSCILFQSPKRIDILDRKGLEGGLFENADQAEIFFSSI
jgi:ATP-dependent DNA helicase RecG